MLKWKESRYLAFFSLSIYFRSPSARALGEISLFFLHSSSSHKVKMSRRLALLLLEVCFPSLSLSLSHSLIRLFCLIHDSFPRHISNHEYSIVHNDFLSVVFFVLTLNF